MWEWVDRNYGRIIAPAPRLGVSADWSREKFTMDPGPALAVRTMFVRLYEKGLIYRGDRMTNWCPRLPDARCRDLEVEHEEEQGMLCVRPLPAGRRDGTRRASTSRSPRRGPRRSWPTSAWRCTRRTSATRT